MRVALLLERKRRLEEAKTKKEIKHKKKRYSPRFCTICDEDKLNHKRKYMFRVNPVNICSDIYIDVNSA